MLICKNRKIGYVRGASAKGKHHAVEITVIRYVS